MNKKIFTLLIIFLSLSNFSFAEGGERYVYLRNGEKVLTWSKVEKKDKIVLDATPVKGTEKKVVDLALWMPKFVEVIGEDSVFQFINKGTKQLLSFSTEKNKGGELSTDIAVGINKFIYSRVEDGGSPIYAVVNNQFLTLSEESGNVDLIFTKNISDGAKFKLGDAPSLKLTKKEDLTGSLNTIKLVFNDGEQEEIFTRSELIPTEREDGKFCFQLVGEENSKKGTKQPQYITVDTVSCIEGSVKAAGFVLDTIVAVGKDTYQKLGNKGLQEFRVSMDLGNDALTLEMDQMVRFNKDGKYEIITHDKIKEPFYVGYLVIGKESKLVVNYQQIELPVIKLFQGTPVKLPNGTGVYSLKVVTEGDKHNGKYFVGGSNYVDAVSVYDPTTQVFIKENEDGTYSMQARESKTVSGNTAYGEALFAVGQPLYAVDKAKDLYRWEGGVTYEIKPMDVDVDNKHIGYKHFTKKEMASKSLTFSLQVKNGQPVYWSIDKKNQMIGTIDADEAVELRLYEGKDIATDTIYYGADKLGDKMYRVAYAISTPYEEGAKQYLNYDAADKNRVKLMDKDPERYFFFKENKDGGSYKIVSSDEKGDAMITMNLDRSAVFYASLVGGDEAYFNIESAEAPTYNEFKPGVFTISSGSDMLTSVDGVAKFMHPETKALALNVPKNFQLYIDTAYIQRGDDNTKLGYYIYDYESYNKEEGKVSGKLFSAEGDYVINPSLSGDSAVFRPVEVVADSVYYTDELKDEKPVRELVTENNSVVCFKYVNDNECHIALMNDPEKVLVNMNGVLFFGEGLGAAPITLEPLDVTENEETVIPTIKVLTGKEQITVIGAAGKKMNVYNILGQLLVNKVLSSDQESFVLPSGVVVINIENEESVKAVVR